MSLPHLSSSSYPVTTSVNSNGTAMSSQTNSAISSPGTLPRTTCCDGGRPVMTDPHTGNTICSCQYSPSLLATYPRVTSLADSVYSSPYATQPGYSTLTGVDPSAFYSPLTPAYGYKDTSPDAWRGLTQPAAYYPYDPTMSAYPYSNSYGGMDLNGARRKNATRESTSTLKAWLNEHRKNPYPTKGEKIMLAIITKMTLTQVSTWFANARRRLKKENKMTWSPRNKCDDGDDKGDSDGGGDDDDKDDGGKSDSDDEDSKGLHEPSHCMKHKSGSGYDDSLPTNCTIKDPASPLDATSPFSTVRGLDDGGKPRIWSLADTATSGSPSGRRSPSLMVKSEHDSPDSMSPTLDQFTRTAASISGAYNNGNGVHHHYDTYSTAGSRYMDLNNINARQMYSTTTGLSQNLSGVNNLSQNLMPMNNNNNTMNKGNYLSMSGSMSGQYHHGNLGGRYPSPSHHNNITNGYNSINTHKDDKDGHGMMGFKSQDLRLSDTDLTTDPITAFKPVMKI